MYLREIGRTFTVNVPNEIDGIKKCNSRSSNRIKTTATCFTEASSFTGRKSENIRDINDNSDKN